MTVIRHTGIVTRNIKKSLWFWTKLLDFKIKKKRAVDIARIWIGAKVCAIAKLGPRYIPIKIKNNDVNTRFISTDVDHQAAIPKGRQRAIEMAGSHPYALISFLPQLSASLAPKNAPPAYVSPFIKPRIITKVWKSKLGSKVTRYLVWKADLE